MCLLYRLSFKGGVLHNDLHRLQRVAGHAFRARGLGPVCASPLHVSPRQAVVDAQQIQAMPDNGQGGLYLRLNDFSRTGPTQLRTVALLVYPHQNGEIGSERPQGRDTPAGCLELRDRHHRQEGTVHPGMVQHAFAAGVPEDRTGTPRPRLARGLRIQVHNSVQNMKGIERVGHFPSDAAEPADSDLNLRRHSRGRWRRHSFLSTHQPLHPGGSPAKDQCVDENRDQRCRQHGVVHGGGEEPVIAPHPRQDI